MSAQEQTIRQYHELMKLNAVSHIVRAAREMGLFEALSGGQRTSQQLCETLGLDEQPADLFLASLVASGVIEKYGEDYALSQAMRLLCQYDADLGDARWQRLVDSVRGNDSGHPLSDEDHFDAVAATQWIHTAAAMQAAEILDVGGENSGSSTRILDLGCGSAVWSCAMAYRDESAEVTLVDSRARLEAAKSTAESIDLLDRAHLVEGIPGEVELPAEAFDLVVVAQRLHSLGGQAGDRLLRQAVSAAARGGRVVVIDLFQSPVSPPGLAEALAALRIELETRSGWIPSLQATQQRLVSFALTKVQFTFLAASKEGLGMAVGTKASESPEGAPNGP